MNATSIWWTFTSSGRRSKRLSSSSPERACANEILLRTLQEQHAAHHAGPLGAVLQLHVPADLLLCVCGDVPCRHGAGHRVLRGHGADHGNPGQRSVGRVQSNKTSRRDACRRWSWRLKFTPSRARTLSTRDEQFGTTPTKISTTGGTEDFN